MPLMACNRSGLGIDVGGKCCTGSQPRAISRMAPAKPFSAALKVSHAWAAAELRAAALTLSPVCRLAHVTKALRTQCDLSQIGVRPGVLWHRAVHLI